MTNNFSQPLEIILETCHPLGLEVNTRNLYHEKKMNILDPQEVVFKT